MLLEVSRGEVFALQSCFPPRELWSYISGVSCMAIPGKKMVPPCRDDAVVGYVHCQCLSQFFHPISARLADDHSILTIVSPGGSPFPASLAVPVPYKHGSPFPRLTIPQVTPLSFATLRHLLWDPHHPTISIFFLEIHNRGLIFCTVFCCWVFWQNKPYKTQVVSPVRNRTGCVLTPHSCDCHWGLQVNALLLVVCVGSHSPKISCLHQFSCSEAVAHVLPSSFFIW